MNLPTIIVGLAVFIPFAAVIRHGIQNLRQGKSGCSCGGNCGACGLCQKNMNQDKTIVQKKSQTVL